MTVGSPPADDPGYKLAALQALATGGTQAKAAVDKARSDMAASQTSATREAMASAAAYGLGQAGTDALTQPIDKAYNSASGITDRIAAPRVAQFTNLQAPTGKLFDAKSALNSFRAANKGGGGGGSGSGSTKKEKALDWFDDNPDLKNKYGTKSALAKTLQSIPQNEARQYIQSLGADAGTAAEVIPFGYSQASTAQQYLRAYAQQGATKQQMLKYVAQQSGGKDTAEYAYWASRVPQIIKNNPKK